MIVAQISAGIGNQLFQYATARAVSLRANLPLRLDLAYYSIQRNRSHRLEAYNLPASPAMDDDLSPYFSTLHKRRYVRRIAQTINTLRPFAWRRIIQEKSAKFDPRLLAVRRSVYLSGFWQCERYFEDLASTIRQELTLTTPVPDCYRCALAQIEACESVGLVVRRGDYLNIPNTQGICTLEYYRRAIEVITAKAPGRRVFVFSDDIQWCKENLAFEAEAVFVPNETPERPEEHLRILSKCRHFILANSSYAWWGAWLSPYRDKVVIGPAKWMQKAAQLGDLLPAQWLRIPSNQ